MAKSPTPQLDAMLLIPARFLSVCVGDEAQSSRDTAAELRALLGKLETTFNFALKQSEIRGDAARVLGADIDAGLELLRYLPDALDAFADDADENNRLPVERERETV